MKLNDRQVKALRLLVEESVGPSSNYGWVDYSRLTRPLGDKDARQTVNTLEALCRRGLVEWSTRWFQGLTHSVHFDHSIYRPTRDGRAFLESAS